MSVVEAGERERGRENKERDRDIETKTERQTEKIERARERSCSYIIYTKCVCGRELELDNFTDRQRQRETVRQRATTCS